MEVVGKMINIAIVGKANTGKSSLANMLAGKMVSVVDDEAYTTSDDHSFEYRVENHLCSVFDTISPISQYIEQISDIFLWVFSDISKEDQEVINKLRKLGKPIIPIWNKIHGKTEKRQQEQQDIATELGMLGFDDPIAVTAKNGSGSSRVYQGILDEISKMSDSDSTPDECIADEVEDIVKHDESEEMGNRPRGKVTIACVGRANVGKSTLINKLLGYERVRVQDEIGTTKDPVHLVGIHKRNEIYLVDTAGVTKHRRTPQIHASLDKIRKVQCSIVVIDATQVLQKTDKVVISEAVQSCVTVVALNKWDLVERKKEAEDYIRWQLSRISGTKQLPMVKISAKSGYNVNKLITSLVQRAKRWDVKYPTSKLNKWLHDFLAKTEQRSLMNAKIKYIVQSGMSPPRFTIFANNEPSPQVVRYISSSLAQHLKIEGIPITIKVRTNQSNSK